MTTETILTLIFTIQTLWFIVYILNIRKQNRNLNSISFSSYNIAKNTKK